MTDLLVGAVSMPLSIALDALILRGTVSPSIFYFLSEIGVSFLITFFIYFIYYFVVKNIRNHRLYTCITSVAVNLNALFLWRHEDTSSLRLLSDDD